MKKLLLSSAIALSMAGTAVAETFTVTGTITDSQPIYKTRTTSNPIQKCWNEDVPIYGQTQNDGFSVPGAIIGGIIGNNVGNGKNNGAAGAVIGGLLGNAHGDNRNGNIVGYRQEQRCSNNTTYTSETYEVYSHSVIEFFEDGRFYRLKFNKN